jgi:hypothetical protein
VARSIRPAARCITPATFTIPPTAAPVADPMAVLTRSVLQVLYELGAQIEVSAADVARGETLPTEPGDRLIQVRQGDRAPADPYAAVRYRGQWFWIDAGDYRSKGAFTFAYVLQVLAENGQGQRTPIVTIPTQ